MGESAILKEVAAIREKLPRCGTRKLHHLLSPTLAKHGIKLGRDALLDLLREHNLLIKSRKSCRTTNSLHRYRKYPNIVKDLVPYRPDQLWVSDITYIGLGAGFCYLSLITDAYSRKIVGWALRMALAQREGGSPPTHHSDRGTQYCSHEYVKLLKKNGIGISMTENGDPYENALAERMNRTIKEEFLQYRFFATPEQAAGAAEWAVGMYNGYRPHSKLGMRPPSQAHSGGI